MPKFTFEERSKMKNIVATLSLKRLSDKEIINEIELITGNKVSREYLYKVRQSIKKESYKWYMKLRNSHYEYLHEFKERMNEIYYLQQKHHEIIKKNENNPTVQQASLNELHKLNITLANYLDILPQIINGITLSKTPENKDIKAESESIITV
jgi:hypothetical protein